MTTISLVEIAKYRLPRHIFFQVYLNENLTVLKRKSAQCRYFLLKFQMFFSSNQSNFKHQIFQPHLVVMSDQSRRQ